MGDASTRYEGSNRRLSICNDYAETSDSDDDVRRFYEVSRPYLRKMCFLDDLYDIRRDSKILMIDVSDVIAEMNGDITIGEAFHGYEEFMANLD